MTALACASSMRLDVTHVAYMLGITCSHFQHCNLIRIFQQGKCNPLKIFVDNTTTNMNSGNAASRAL